MVWLRRDLNRGANSNVDPETIPFEEGLINSVDRHLQELGFSNLCLRIANKFKDEIEKIAVEQKDIKTGIERLDHAITEHLAANDLVYEAVPAVIVIDDDDDEEKQERAGKSSAPPSTSVTGIVPSRKELTTVVSRSPDSRDPSKVPKSTTIVASSSSTPQTKGGNDTREMAVVASAASTGQGGVEGSSIQPQIAAEPSSAQRQVRSALSQKAEALAKRLSSEALLLRNTSGKQIAASSDTRQSETGATSKSGSGSQTLSLTTQVGTLSVSTPQRLQSSSVVARKRPGLLVGQDTHVQHNTPASPTDSGTTEGINTRLRSKVPSGATNASPLGSLANDILKSKAYTLSDPILKLTPIPVPPSSQSQGTSSESSSKSDSITASPSSSPPSVSPPLGSIGLRDFLSEGLTPSSLVQKVQETAKAKKSERYIIQFKEGLQVLGKPDKSDMWYPGIIEKVTPGRKGHDKYLVKFDCKRNRLIHGQLPVNHLAPVFYPDAPDLSVGSRVVATRPGDTVDSRLKNKSRDLAKAKADILFGGIIAELACEENKNRYLIFFDDGFAQYLSLRKLRHVVYSSSNVWDDVSVHCRDFCKEYLQEYPYRPMVRLKVGETIQTEWNGKWLNAKVINLDCSLVKVLFDIDQRTEWIYRGSTRLEPLYTELERRDMVAAVQLAKSASKAKQKKKGRTGAEEEEPEPEPEPDIRIEDRITKPSFGVSKFSLKDPDGKDQWKEWEKEMSPREKEVQVAKALGIQRVTYATSQNTRAAATASPQMVPSPPQTEVDIPIATKTVDSNGDETTESMSSSTSLDSGAKGKDPRPAIVVPAAIVRATPSVPKGPSPGSALTTSAVRASRSLRGKTPVIPYGEATRETEATWEAPWLKRRRRSQIPPEEAVATVQTDSGSREEQEDLSMQVTAAARSRSTASLLQEKLARNLGKDVPDSPPSENEAITTVFSSAPSIRGPHQCTSSCCAVPRLPEQERRKHNPLLIPLLSGWMRETAKRRPGYRRDVYYRTPCYRRLRSLSNVTQYLLETKTDAVTVDQFCFDPAVSCREFNPKMLHPRTRIEDLSHGKETVDISCVNENTNEYPPVVEYINKTIVADGVDLYLDREFLQCCDCTDLCQDKSKCSCCQLTVSASAAITGVRDENAGYAFRRLPECVTTGIYECNMRCKCASACFNRVVQNGIQARLQIFMTANKGWGLRCLDDIPKGAFICCYAGQILTEEMANKEGKDFGDEYLAELDHIEVVEQAKEGYESDVPELRDIGESERGGSEPTSEEGSSKDDFSFDDDSDSYSSCSDSSDSDQSYRPEEDFEPLVKRKKQEDTQPEVTLATEIIAKAPVEPQSGHSGFDVIDLTLDSEEEMDTAVDEDISPPPVPKPLVKSSHESSLRHIIRRLVTCVNESKRASSSDRSTSKPESERELSTDAGSAVELNSVQSSASLNFPLGAVARTVKEPSSNAVLPTEIPVVSKANLANEAERKGSDRPNRELLAPPVREEKQSLPTVPAPDTSTSPENGDTNAMKSEDYPNEDDKVSTRVNRAGEATTGKKVTGGNCELLANDSLEERKSKSNTPSSVTDERGTFVKLERRPESDKVDFDSEAVSEATGHDNKARLSDSETKTSSAYPPASLSGSVDRFSIDSRPVETREWKGEEMGAPLVIPRLSVGGKLITKKGSASLSALLGGAKKTRALALKSTGHKLFSSPRSSTGGHMLRKVMTLRPGACAQGSDQSKSEVPRSENKQASTRLLYGEDSCYVIDAKSFGNAGRYLNHSCSPNLFVQNVFYETHDLRFPTVAFFALQNIPALQELTWDYSYDVGSVPGKVILCRCGAGECRGRLL